MADSIVLNIVECRKCGTSYWAEVKQGGGIDAGPCCFGHPVLDIDSYPDERAAIKAHHAWAAADQAAITARLAEINTPRYAA